MRHLAPFMQAVVNHPVGRTIVATDAEGSNDSDFGGYGAVAAQVRSELAEEALRVGTRAGRVVAKLDGSIAKWVSGERELKRCIGVSKLPRELISAGQQQWCEVTKGRWRWAEHIMLGEGRVAVKLMGLVATFPGAPRTLCAAAGGQRAVLRSGFQGAVPHPPGQRHPAQAHRAGAGCGPGVRGSLA